MTDDLLPPPELGAGLGDGLPLPDWLTDGGLPGLPDLPDLFDDSGAVPAVVPPVAASVAGPPVVAEPMPATTPPPRELPEPGDGPLLVAARVVVEEGGKTLCFRTAVCPPPGGWDGVRAVFHTPAGVKSAQVNRKPKVSPGRVVWSLGSLAAGSSVPLIVRVPNGPHLAAATTHPPAFEITHTPRVAPDPEEPVAAPTAVPLAVEATAPATFDLDDVVPFRAAVTNPSDRPCRNITLGIIVPPELRYDSSDGEYRWEAGRVKWRIAELEPGETRTVTAWLKGHLPGPVRVTADATTAGGTSTATAESVCELGRAEPSSGLLDLLRELDPGAATDLSVDRAGSAVSGERHVLFRMGEAAYAVPVTQLREVIRPPAVTPVPGGPDWLLGLANVRGDAMSIIDFPAALGLEAGGDGKRSVLVAQTADGQTAVGLTVDEVIGIRRLAPNPWSAADAPDAGRVGEFVTGLCDHRDRLTPVLDLDRALRSDALVAFGAA